MTLQEIDHQIAGLRRLYSHVGSSGKLNTQVNDPRLAFLNGAEPTVARISAEIRRLEELQRKVSDEIARQI